ncbi:MAG TPA: hypothetical protein VF476_01960 [Chitinophagaceae bacterium]
MKKYLLSLFAIAIAIGLNAFSRKKGTTMKTEGPELIWYAVNGSNEVDPGEPLNPGNAMDRDEFHTEFPGACIGDSNPCVRGFDSEALPTVGDEAGEEDILKD